MNKKDASIKLVKAQFIDNGTYTCDVKNPPDVGVIPSSLQLRVVMKGKLSIVLATSLKTEDAH